MVEALVLRNPHLYEIFKVLSRCSRGRIMERRHFKLRESTNSHHLVRDSSEPNDINLFITKSLYYYLDLKVLEMLFNCLMNLFCIYL